jgi:Holliday junction resolvase RusA-like endonuclease
MERDRTELFVQGTPKPQGSKRAIMGKHQRFPSVIESAGQALKDWRGDVRYAASRLGVKHEGSVSVCLHFHLQRPKAHFGSGKNSGNLKPSAPKYHTQKPDVDKLSRAVLDALTDVLFGDDSCVCHLEAKKEWAVGKAGCLITVQSLEATDDETKDRSSQGDG